MSGTRIETAPLPAEGSAGPSRVPLTVAEPAGVARGGIVVLHEARGLTPVVLDLVEALAAEGWLTVAPHLYHRVTGDPAPGGAAPAGSPDAGGDLVAGLTGSTVLADCDGAFAWLAQRGTSADRIGVVGFDTGGAVALVVAASRNIGAAVSIAGGGIVTPLSDGLPALVAAAPSLACPWLGLYGEDDEVIPLAEVDALREAAARAEVATDVVTYLAAGHRLPGRDTDTERDAGERILGWFDSNLR